MLIEKFEKQVNIDKSFDIGFREFIIGKKNIRLYYVTGLIDTAFVIEIIKSLKISSNEYSSSLYIENNLVHQQVEKCDSLDESIKHLLSGLLIVNIEGNDFFYIIDTRSYPGRSPNEPDTEKVVRGSRDGFTENIVINTALTRRRIRNPNFVNELVSIGEYSKTDICISYLDDKVDKKLLNEIRLKITNLDIEELTMSDKALEELISNQSYSPYPIVRYSERPDIIANHILKGKICIFVDTSPSVIILPINLFSHLQHAEEFRQVPLIGTFMRFLRYIGVISSLFLVPIWLLFVYNKDYLPESLSFIGLKETSNIPIIIQILVAELGIEFLRMAAIHTPNPISTSMGIIAGILVGDIAISVGLFEPEIVLYTAISQIGSYATPSYELALANKFSKTIFILFTYLFGLIGLIFSIFTWLLYLVKLKSFGHSYLKPLIPFDKKNIINIFVRKKYN